MQESSLHAAGSGTVRNASPLVRPLAGLAHSLKHRGQDYQIVTGFLCQADGPSVRCQVVSGGKVIKEVVEPCQRESSEHRKRVVALHKAAIINVMSGVWAAPKAPTTRPQPTVAPEVEAARAAGMPAPSERSDAPVAADAACAETNYGPGTATFADIAALEKETVLPAQPAPAADLAPVAVEEPVARPEAASAPRRVEMPEAAVVELPQPASIEIAEPASAAVLPPTPAQLAWEREATDGESVELGETTSSSDEPPVAKPISSVEQARRLLAELSAMEAFAGLGVYGRSGQLVSSVVSSGLDMAELGKGYASLLEPLSSAMSRVDPSDVHVVRIDTAQRIVAVASFEPYFHQLGLEISDALGFIVVVMNHDSPFDQVLPAVKTFMHLIVEDLRSFMIRRHAIN